MTCVLCSISWKLSHLTEEITFKASKGFKRILWFFKCSIKAKDCNFFIGDDEEIYANFVATTGLTAAYEELDTSRVVRISCSGFPQYFAILSRIKEEVRAIGADGGKVTSSHEPHVQAYFPKGIFAF